MKEEESEASLVAKLTEEVKVQEDLIKSYESLIDAIPPCPAHGRCIPHAIEWINQVKTFGKLITRDFKKE